MAEAFMGYLLPWGQMSYWGAQVIINLFAAIPFVGEDLAILIRGDYVVGDATLNRFFSLPRHRRAAGAASVSSSPTCFALHDVGSNNPDGIEIKAKKDRQDGHPARRHSHSIPTTPCTTSIGVGSVPDGSSRPSSSSRRSSAATSWSSTTSSRPTR